MARAMVLLPGFVDPEFFPNQAHSSQFFESQPRRQHLRYADRSERPGQIDIGKAKCSRVVDRGGEVFHG